MSLSPRAKLSAAIVRVTGVDPNSSEASKRGLAPYFGAILRGLIRREMDEPTRAVFAAQGINPTMGVSADGVLTWAPEYVDTFADDKLHELAYALLHEVLHVVKKHHERTVALGIVPEPTEEYMAKATIANLASDACNNEEIEAIMKIVGDAKIPKEWILPETLKQPRNLVFEERYRRLLQDTQNSPSKKSDKLTTGAGKGWCGGCAGHPHPGEPEGGAKGEGRSEAEMERFRKESAEAVKGMAARGRGFVPDSLVRWADEQLKAPTIPWQEKLARIVRGAVALKSGATDLTFSRISRRQGGVGFGVGRPVIPALRGHTPRVSVLVDVSGSVSQTDLTAAASELQGILNASGADVTVATVDAALQGIKECRTIHEAVKLFKGGGGTVLIHGWDALLKREPAPDVIIAFTDGEIGGAGDGYPAEEPEAKVIWALLRGEGGSQPCPYGEVVYVKDEEP